MPLRFEQDLQRLLERLPPSGSIVDMRYGRGQYSDAFLSRGYAVFAFCDQHPPDAIVEGMPFTAINTAIDFTSLPHRTMQALWATDTMVGLDPASVKQRLSLFYDWLLPGGLVSFHLPEGEGKKSVSVQGAVGRTQMTVHQFDPGEIDQMVQNAGLRTIDAWREGPLERQTIHIIAQRP